VSHEPSEAEAPAVKPLRLFGMSFDPHILIYSTIILLTAYAIYDEGDEPLIDGRWAEVIGISLAPLFALSMAHAFSDALDIQIRHGRRLTRQDRWHVLRTNLQYLYVGVPPSLLLIVLTLLRWGADDAVILLLLLGLVTLFIWGAYAAKAAGLPVWRRVTFGIGYLVMGAFVLIVELLLTH
jgi:hypothetical protein